MKVNMPITKNEDFMTEGNSIIAKAILKGQITVIPLASSNSTISRMK